MEGARETKQRKLFPHSGSKDQGKEHNSEGTIHLQKVTSKGFYAQKGRTDDEQKDKRSLGGDRITEGAPLNPEKSR